MVTAHSRLHSSNLSPHSAAGLARGGHHSTLQATLQTEANLALALALALAPRLPSCSLSLALCSPRDQHHQCHCRRTQDPDLQNSRLDPKIPGPTNPTDTASPALSSRSATVGPQPQPQPHYAVASSISISNSLATTNHDRTPTPTPTLPLSSGSSPSVPDTVTPYYDPYFDSKQFLPILSNIVLLLNCLLRSHRYRRSCSTLALAVNRELVFLLT